MGPEDKVLDVFIYYSHYLNPSDRTEASLLINLEPSKVVYANSYERREETNNRH
jgi:hypothetical protein